MAKLTQIQLDEGADLLRDSKLPEYLVWVKSLNAHIPIPVIQETLQCFLSAHEIDRAVSYHQRTLGGLDPQQRRKQMRLAQIAVTTVAILLVVGGGYLIFS